MSENYQIPMTTGQRRLAALQTYEIMDTPQEEAFDDIIRLTAYICGTPIALFTLLDLERQWFKAKIGIDASETPIEQAFCVHAIQQEHVFMVPDATKDDRFSSNPLVVSGPHIRFYAGAPLVTPDGVPLGTLCAIDRVPRDFSDAQKEALAALARQVIMQLELRRTMKLLAGALQDVRALQDLLPMCAWCRKVRDGEAYWSSVEEYLLAHTDIQMSHGVCPECKERVRREWSTGSAGRS